MYVLHTLRLLKVHKLTCVACKTMSMFMIKPIEGNFRSILPLRNLIVTYSGCYECSRPALIPYFEVIFQNWLQVDFVIGLS